MDIIIAECSVEYSGRGLTHLPRAVRMIMIKRDGSVSIHSDDSGYKPINYMLPPSVVHYEKFVAEVEGDPIERWIVEGKNESLVIDIYSIISETAHTLSEVDPGLKRSWTEKQLQSWIAGHMELVFGEGWSLVQREYQTGSGPVDILALDQRGKPVAVEVKRTAHIQSIDQTYRYVQALSHSDNYRRATGLVVALKIKPKTLVLAEQRGIRTLEIPNHLFRNEENK